MINVKIYTSHHKPSAFLDASAIVPLHVGKALSYNDIGCDGDDTGENISYKNPYYCELTAQYWVWKNAPASDFVGFMHYRRHLNFSEKQDYQEDIWGVVNDDVISSQYQDKFAITDDGISRCLQDTDILLPKKWDVRAAGSKNNLHHYETSAHLHGKDYQAALNCLTTLYPEYEAAAKAFNDATDGYYTNIFVMRWDIFQTYCAWLFSILNALENQIAFDNYNKQEQRVIGHIAERLFNIFIIHQREKNNLNIRELQRTFVRHESFNGHLQPAFAEHNVPIVICFDDNYALSGGALVNSIVKNAHLENHYDLTILENGISPKNKNRLLSLVAKSDNFKLRFFDVNAFAELKTVHLRGHFSAATYARLYIPKLFQGFEKVIFIDADTIVETDLAQLLDAPLGDNLVAAVRDVVMEGFCKFGTLAQADDYIHPANDYLTDYLEMKEPGHYFQAGLLVFNITRMIQENTFARLMAAMKEKNYWFLDQDIMNRVFYDRVHYLPMTWNVYHGNGNTDEFFPNLKFATYMRFLQARMAPNMIHYAGEQKPWNNPNVDFFDNFAKYIMGTPWQQEFLTRLIASTIATFGSSTQPILFQTKLKQKLMPIVNLLAPRGSVRRQKLSRVYYKFRRVILG
ncbi:DUF4422 domain-containing protein [Martelella alba]|uniref:DUF4422 domain-containing protein n=1 Tax=Martelella alba TaxID=2590451 RepID=A0ABY2SJU5_9HYPH|nr:DUF4422 domain-containing protein [Martelella alba]TKI05760.1 DUF4422 domain-containing protein [Martelella alba]